MPDVTRELVEDAVSDPTDRYILAACIDRARPVQEIAEWAGLPRTTAYRHINELEDQQLLFVERSAMTEDGKTYDLYRSRLRNASIRVEAREVVVEWETVEAIEDRVKRMWDRL